MSGAKPKTASKVKKWNVVVEPTGTPVQREKALKEATRYALIKLAGRERASKGELRQFKGT